MKKLSKQVTYWLGVVAVGLIVGIGIQFVQAWTEPPVGVTPPGGNLGAPINTGGSELIGQAKTGFFSISSIGTAFTVPNGNVGIGTPTPGTNRLEVVGGTTKTTGGLIIETRTASQGSPTETGRMWLCTDC